MKTIVTLLLPFLLFLNGCLFTKPSTPEPPEPKEQAYETIDIIFNRYLLLGSREQFRGETLITRYDLTYAVDKLLQRPELQPQVKHLTPDKEVNFDHLLPFKGGDVVVKEDQLQAVQRMVETYQFLSVYPDQTFRGERNLTRYELADFCRKTLSRLGLGMSQRTFLTYPMLKSQGGDIPDTHWGKEAIELALAYGLMQGETESRFNGLRRANHYEMLLVLKGLIELLETNHQP